MFISALTVQADVLLSESFEGYTAGSGNSLAPNWTVYSNTLQYASTAFASDGSQSLFIRNGAAKFSYVRSTNFIPITGSGDLVVTFDYKSITSISSSRGLKDFSIDFGSGLEPVLQDFGIPDGVDSSYTGTTIINPNTASTGASPFVNYKITIPTSYYVDTLGATTFKLSFITEAGGGGQDFHIDNINVSTIPEPSTLVMTLGSVVAFLGLRRFKRKK